MIKIITKIENFDRNKSYPNVVEQPNVKIVPVFGYVDHWTSEGAGQEYIIIRYEEISLDDPRKEIFTKEYYFC